MITYSCGCRFKTQEFKAAVLHAVTTGHTVTAHGLIQASEYEDGGQQWNGPGSRDK